MSIPTNLLTLEVGNGSEILEAEAVQFDHYEISSSQDEEVIVISGTLTVSP